jgi:predicted XRE-type DNA-binding protein
MSSESYEVGSGNVFADLGLADPEERLLKAELALKIRDLIAARGWTQAQAAKALGATRADVSELVRGRLTRFSVDRLLRFVRSLGQRVTITMHDAEASDADAENTLPAAAAARGL